MRKRTCPERFRSGCFYAGSIYNGHIIDRTGRAQALELAALPANDLPPCIIYPGAFSLGAGSAAGGFPAIYPSTAFTGLETPDPGIVGWQPFAAHLGHLE